VEEERGRMLARGGKSWAAVHCAGWAEGKTGGRVGCGPLGQNQRGGFFFLLFFYFKAYLKPI